MSTENKFEWTDELVKDFVRENFNCNELNYLPHAIWQFKNSKQQNTIQKDWEIMSFVVESSRVVLGKTEEGDFGNNIFRIDENELFKSPNHKIHSIKRIFDGEVFSLGDNVGYGQNPYRTFKINSFNVNGHNMMAVDSGGRELNIIILNNNKQPLFQTEDGIEVKEQDSVWVVNSAFAKPFICSVKGIEWYNETNNHFKYFSTEEAAQTWVLLNKPVLSVNDVQSIFRKEILCKVNTYREPDSWATTRWGTRLVYNDVNVIDLDKLKELAKSKIENK